VGTVTVPGIALLAIHAPALTGGRSPLYGEARMRQFARLAHWIEYRIMRYIVPVSAVQAKRRSARPLLGHKAWRR
jgi:hypothetical protein